MAFIHFEKSSNKNYLSKKELEEKLNERDKLKTENKKKNQEKLYKDSLSINKQWMLPSLEEKLNETPSKRIRKKHKKRVVSSSAESSSSSDEDNKSVKRREGKKRSKSRSEEYSSRSRKEKRKKRHKRVRSSSPEEFVKKSESTDDSCDSAKQNARKQVTRDDWMNFETLVPTVEREKKELKQKKDVNKCITDAPGQNARELNPYWKNGGTGLPSSSKQTTDDSSGMIGNTRGLEWYQRAFKRAQEQAAEEERSLEDVVSERWGSLEALKSLISRAEIKETDKYSGKTHDRFYSSRQTSSRSYKDPIEDKPKAKFWKPGDDRRKEDRYKEKETRRGNWKKEEYRKRKSPDYQTAKQPSHPEHNRKDKSTRESPSEEKRGGTVEQRPSEERGKETKALLNETENVPAVSESKPSVLTDEQLNALAAKLVKAEILGNEVQVNKLRNKLEEARKCRENAVAAAGSSTSMFSEETIILLKTNEKGLTVPVQEPTLREPVGGRRKKQKTETHSDGKRVRYFHDDDSRDIRQMFESEKLGTADDDKRMFINLMAKKRVGGGSDEEDAAFADAARMKESDGKVQDRELQKAAKESIKRKKTMEGCCWCLDSTKRAKHLIVSIGETCYLCLPAEDSLTPLHCLIVPVEHVTCGTLLDENVWEEMHKFRKALMAMAVGEGEDLVMFEQARALNTHPHMVMHCVILEKEAGDLAPIYFKKAILDCESEWTTNKKIVDIKGRDVRRSVPKGLPYFSVEFGNSGGFAHVIEDEKVFSKNFAQEVIGGMLDLDHRKWRKAQKTSFASQMEKTVAFARKWGKYDFTRKEKPSSSSSDSSSDEN